MNPAEINDQEFLDKFHEEMKEEFERKKELLKKLGYDSILELKTTNGVDGLDYLRNLIRISKLRTDTIKNYRIDKYILEDFQIYSIELFFSIDNFIILLHFKNEEDKLRFCLMV